MFACFAFGGLAVHQGLAHQCDTWTALFESGRTLDHNPGMLNGLVHHDAEATGLRTGEGCEGAAQRLLHKLCSGPRGQFTKPFNVQYTGGLPWQETSPFSKMAVSYNYTGCLGVNFKSCETNELCPSRKLTTSASGATIKRALSCL